MVNICSSSFSSSYLVLLIHCEVPPYLHRFRPGPTSRPPDAAVATRAALFLPRPRCGRGRRLEHPVTAAGTETVLIGLQKCRGFHPEKWGVCGGPLQYFKLFFFVHPFLGAFCRGIAMWENRFWMSMSRIIIVTPNWAPNWWCFRWIILCSLHFFGGLPYFRKNKQSFGPPYEFYFTSCWNYWETNDMEREGPVGSCCWHSGQVGQSSRMAFWKGGYTLQQWSFPKIGITQIIQVIRLILVYFSTDTHGFGAPPF